MLQHKLVRDRDRHRRRSVKPQMHATTDGWPLFGVMQSIAHINAYSVGPQVWGRLQSCVYGGAIFLECVHPTIKLP